MYLKSVCLRAIFSRRKLQKRNAVAGGTEPNCIPPQPYTYLRGFNSQSDLFHIVRIIYCVCRFYWGHTTIGIRGGWPNS